MSNAFILLPSAYNPESQDYERPKVRAKMNWISGLFIQGGHEGVVFFTSGKSAPYKTAFVEVVDGKKFIRGEGATLDDAEIDAWNQWLAWCEEERVTALKTLE